MRKTLVEKIITYKSDKDVSVNKIVDVNVDVVMIHDGSAVLFFKNFYELNGKVFDNKKIIAAADHFCPPSSEERANILNQYIKFLRKNKIDTSNLFKGICHQILAEHSLVVPGKVVVGIDSHTTTVGALGCFATGMGHLDILNILLTGKIWMKVPQTYRIDLLDKKPFYVSGKDIVLKLLRSMGEDGAMYKALEFYDKTENKISMDSRLTICNMAVEMGAKTSIFNVDDITREYLKEKGSSGEEIHADDKAIYEKEISLDVSNLEPLVAKPHSPSNVVSVKEIEGTKIDQVFIGSCSSGRLEDISIAAKILEGKKVCGGVKVIVAPASQKIYLNSLSNGYLEKIASAGAIILNPSCGPCVGIDKGLLAKGEVAISTSSRNFKGRMGSLESEVYLASTATAAASAIEGKICDPRKYLE